MREYLRQFSWQDWVQCGVVYVFVVAIGFGLLISLPNAQWKRDLLIVTIVGILLLPMYISVHRVGMPNRKK